MKHRSFAKLVGTLGCAAAIGLSVNSLHVSAAVPAARQQTTPRWLVYNAKAHTATLTLLAVYGGGFDFNGYGNGDMIFSVPAGTKVTVKFSNKDTADVHSAFFTPYTNRYGPFLEDESPAFKGASSPDPSEGSLAGKTFTFTFTATPAGSYAIVCAVPGHAPSGMWDTFTVTKGGKAAIVFKK
jgi:sulfocyanin